MAKYIRLELEEDLIFLQNMFNRAVNKIKNNISSFDLDQAEVICRVHDALHSAANTNEALSLGVPREEIESHAKVSKPAQEKRVKKQSVTKVKSNLCTTHPYYGAVRAPQQDCEGCWKAYKSMNPNTYSRKRKDFERKMEKSA
jgi:hypothetical protein